MAVLPGNPAQLSERAAGYLSSATRIADIAAQLRGMTIPGDAAALGAVRLRAAHTATGLETAHGQYVAAATALADYATHLADAHHRAETAAQAIRYAQQQSTHAHDAALALRQRIDRLEDAGAPDSAIRTLTDQLWDAQHHARSADLAAASAHRDLTIARQDMNTAAETTMARIDTAMPDTAPSTLPGKITGPRTRTRLLLAALSSMSPSELRAHFTTHPEHLDQLRALPPTEIAAWWASLAPPGTTGNSPTQTHLITTIPALIGSLDGIPIHPRIQANQLNALHRLTDAHAELAQLTAARDELDEHPLSPTAPGQAHVLRNRKTTELDDQIHALNLEIAYLARVTNLDGTADTPVQLYLYIPEERRIIEMIGTPGPDTTTTITYVPGTFTTIEGFYEGAFQPVPDFLVKGRPDALAFVWKGSDFPGEGHDPASLGIVPGLLEANDLTYSLANGPRIARFQEGLLQDPLITDTAQEAIAHSHGLPDISAAEMEGAHFDQVESLAGAYLIPGWEPQDGTRYHHQTYIDPLIAANELGLLAGESPFNHPAFEQHIYLPRSPGALLDSTNPLTMIDNHNLIASDDERNFPLLRELLQRMPPG